MNIAVFGTGGVGGYFGTRLAQAGHQVTFIARGAHLESIRAHGLSLVSPLGGYVLYPARATDRPLEVGLVDLVILGVKAWQVPEAAQAIRPMVGPGTMVLPLQNGIEAAGQLIAALGKAPVLGGTCRIISKIAGPGVIEHIGLEPTIFVGELSGVPDERVNRLAGTLREAGIRTETPKNIVSALWQKFIFIAAISGVGAVTRAPFGLLRSVPESRDLYLRAVEEIIALAVARGVSIPNGYASVLDRNLDDLPAEGTSSMQRDIHAGLPSELESQNGAVVRLAGDAGLEVPVNRFLYHALLPQERKARGEA
ncbi:MAG TPA: 2-dehydropantoate 2-reductase [Chloroflexi bacterium]|nr:2-dehydropantoate 2-reductase [Chloroflexota bacterium]